MTETWIPVPEHDGYEVSDEGRVRSVDRMVASRSRAGRSYVRNVPGKVLTPQPHPVTGHLYVQLGGKSGMLKLHHLVLAAFVGPRPEGAYGLHHNDDPADNHPENLYWGTPSENNADCVRNGGHHEATKTHCIRGHVLAPPNLRTASLPVRRCLACDMAQVRLRRHVPREQRTEEVKQSTSDRIYSEIMSGAVEREAERRLTHCARDHHLVAPNLVESALPERRCRACAIARSYCWQHNVAHLMQQIADDRYAQIMGRADAA